MNSAPDTFDRARDVMRRDGRRIVQNLFPGGEWRRGEYWTLNPARNDTKPGSFSISESGLYNDFADGSKGDILDLLVATKRISKTAAAKIIIETGGSAPSVTPSPGKEKKEKPPALFPQPPEAIKTIEKYTSSKWFKENQGTVSRVWEYKNIDGKPQYYIVRCEHSTGKKVIPLYYASDKKAYMGNPVKIPRPLFNCHKIKSSDKILIVEGERCAEINVPGYTLITWPGGTGQVQNADWSCLQGVNDVIIWPDNDEPGLKAAQYINSKIPESMTQRPKEST
jgi:putative DNA primase/helicase